MPWTTPITWTMPSQVSVNLLPFNVKDTVVDKNGNVCIITSISIDARFDRAMKIVFKLQTTDGQEFLADETQIAKVKGNKQ